MRDNFRVVTDEHEQTTRLWWIKFTNTESKDTRIYIDWTLTQNKNVGLTLGDINPGIYAIWEYISDVTKDVNFGFDYCYNLGADSI